MKAMLVLAMVLAAGATLTMAAEPEPIKTVEIGKNRQFLVNGKPFFPIMSWAQSPRSYAKLSEVGINAHCGNADPEAAKAAGSYAVTGFNEKLVGNPYVLGWIHGDEPDMAQWIDPNNRAAGKRPRRTPEELAGTYAKIKAGDKSRPVFVTFTGAFTTMESDYDPATRARLYPQFVKGADVVGFDIYPIYGSGYASHLDWVAKGVWQLRELGGPTRPLYAWIETHKGSRWMTYEKQPDVLPMHTRCEVWMAIIRGATAIGYFTHAWRPSFTEFAPTEDMQKEMKRLDAQITRLAPAILADPAKAKIEMAIEGGLNGHFKATDHEGTLYLFAENIDLGPDAEKLKQFDPIHPRGGKATFTVAGLKAGTKIEVIDEDRSITAGDGAFPDQFAPLAEHIYKIKLD